MSNRNPALPPRGFGSAIEREFNSLLAAASILVVAYLILRNSFGGASPTEMLATAHHFIGPVWPALLIIAIVALYAIGAWICDTLHLAPARNWKTITKLLHWATEASPMLGLLQTFSSLVKALLAYSSNGPGSAASQAAFVGQFSQALGSTIAGGVIALTCFTLHRLLERD